MKKNNSGPVFIVGMNGSGTTMLAESLGQHPLLYSYKLETKELPYVIATVPRYGDLTINKNFRSLWKYVSSSDCFRHVNKGNPVPLPSNWQQLPRNIGAVIDTILKYFAGTENKKRWCIKTPLHVLHMTELSGIFPEAKFIHIIRDGRDCAASFHRRYYRTPDFTIFRWKKVIQIGRAQGALLGSGRYLELQYEDLTSNPEYNMRQICSFLGLKFDEVILKSRQTFLEQRRCDEKSKKTEGIVPNSGKWRDYFDSKQIRRLETIAGKTLAELGYSTEYGLSDEDPPGWKRKIWLYKDHLLHGIILLWSKLSGKRKLEWWVILSTIKVSFKQRRANKD